MLAEFLECSTVNIAGTSGNGNVVLSRYNGLPLPSDIWGVNNIDVDYTITDLTTAPTVPKLEKGLGIISGGNTLVRSRPRITWNGTTFDEHIPGALQFGATPALGNVRVRVAPNADLFVQAPPAIATQASSGGSSIFGDWVPTANLIGAPGTAIGMPVYMGYEYYIPYLCPIRGNIIGLALYVATNAPGAVARMGIYGVGADGLPGPCISLANPIDVSVVGFRGDGNPSAWTVRPGPLMLRCGWFYIGLLATGGHITVGATSRASFCGPSPLGIQDGFGWGAVCYRIGSAGTSTVLPAGVPVGPYGNPQTANENYDVLTVMMAFSN